MMVSIRRGRQVVDRIDAPAHPLNGPIRPPTVRYPRADRERASRSVVDASLLIDGREVTGTELKAKTLRVEMLLDTRGRLSCQLIDPAVVPLMDMDVLLSLDTIPVFGGILVEVTQGVMSDRQTPIYTLTASDNAAILDGLFINGVSPAGTLKSVLEWLVAHGPVGNGFTVDPTQPTGPLIPEMAWPFQSYADAIEQLCVIAQYTSSVSPTRVIRMQPGDSRPAPWGIDETTDTIEALTATRTRADHASVVWVRYGSGAPSDVTWETTGDGTTSVWPVPYQVATRPSVVVVNGVTLPLAGYPPEAGWTGWTFEVAANSDGTLHAPAGAPPAFGDAISVSYLAAWPSAVNAVDYTAALQVHLVLDYPDVFDVEVAQSLADGELARRRGYPQRFALQTARVGLQPGHWVSIDVPRMGLTTTALVTGLRLAHVNTLRAATPPPLVEPWWRFDVDLVEGIWKRDNWLTFWRKANASGGTGTSVTGTIPTTGTGTAVEEVFIGPTDPGDPYELWFDTSATPAAGNAAGGIPAFLGGSRTTARTGTGPIPDWVGVILDKAKLPEGNLNVYGELTIFSGGGTVQAVLMAQNAAAGTWHEVGRSSAVSATAPTFAFFEFTVAAEAGRIAYRLEIAPSVSTAQVACWGSVIGL